MPPASPSPEIPRSRCTATHAPVVVGNEGFSVRRVGSVVALHFETTTGRYTYHLEEELFVRKARGATDDQQNPFRTLPQIQAARDAGAVEAQEMPPTVDGRSRHGSRLDKERERLYIAAYVECHTSGGGNMAAAARRHQLPYFSWKTWCSNHRDLCAQALGDMRPPIFKPKGSLL